MAAEDVSFVHSIVIHSDNKRDLTHNNDDGRQNLENKSRGFV